MILVKYEIYKNDCYNLYTIKTEKFKNCHMEIVFKNKCSRENITNSLLLFDMLLENSKDHPSKREMIKSMQSLYNLNLYSVTSRVGGMLLSNIVADFLDPKYMKKDSLEKIIEFTFSTIFNPNVDNESFDEETYEIVYKRIKNEIESIKEDPKQECILNALKKLDKNSPYAMSMSGDEEILKNLSPKKLYDFYKELMESSPIDIYIIGNLDMKEIDKLIRKNIHLNSIKTQKIKLYLEDINAKKTKEFSDKKDLTDINLVQIYALKNLDDYETDYVMPVWNAIWGSLSLESKLYKTIRGKYGLCYNLTSYYQKYDRMLLLHTSIDEANYNKTKRLIRACYEDMKRGNITEDELNNVKNIIINTLYLIYDSPSKLIDNYLFKNIANLPDIEKRIDEFKKITLDDLIKTSEKIKLVVNYKLGGTNAKN